MRLHFAHTYKIYVCVYLRHVHVYLHVRKPRDKENVQVFNKRVGVARRHPVITVIVDGSGTSLCAAGNHRGRDLTSELHATPVQRKSLF